MSFLWRVINQDAAEKLELRKRVAELEKKNEELQEELKEKTAEIHRLHRLVAEHLNDEDQYF